MAERRSHALPPPRAAARGGRAAGSAGQLGGPPLPPGAPAALAAAEEEEKEEERGKTSGRAEGDCWRPAAAAARSVGTRGFSGASPPSCWELTDISTAILHRPPRLRLAGEGKR